jgi:hypothetical protein
MYDRRHLDETPSPPGIEAALLWSIRAWVIGFSRGIEVQSRITQLWSRLGVPDAANYIDGMMWALSRGVTRTVEINCVCNGETSDDEATLVNLVVQPIVYDRILPLEVLSMATPPSTQAICESAARLRQLLTRAGRDFSSNVVAFPTNRMAASRTLH